MRIALIADTHGNRLALETVLSHCQSQSIDQYVCLGDVASFGPEPAETLRLIRSLNCPVVMGNADDELIDLKPVDNPDEVYAKLRDIDAWGRTVLSTDDVDFMRSFQPTIRIPLEQGQTLLCYHGSPRSFNDRIVVDTAEDELPALLEATPATIYAGGHTHRPYIREFRSSVVMNPGSAGFPYRMSADGGIAYNPTLANYAIMEVDGTAISVTFHRLPYSLETHRDIIRSSGMPHGEWFIGDWIQG